MQVPPRGGDPVEYLLIDPDDSGKNINGREATDDDKARFRTEYEQFKKAQKGEGEAPTPSRPDVAGGFNPNAPAAPPSAMAAAPIGKEEEFIKRASGIVTPKYEDVDGNPVEQRTAESDAQRGEGDQSSAGGVQPYGLADMSAEDAKNAVHSVWDVDQLKAMKREERAGKNRVTVLDAADDQIKQAKHK